MTPTARIAAAIGILDLIRDGTAAEQALTGWARRSRYAGSGDRAAVRDHVFGALRCKRSFAALGGTETGRGLMLGALRAAGQAPDEIFTGIAHAPAKLSAPERAAGRPSRDGAERGDMPDWLWPEITASLGADADAAAEVLRHRAPVHLRVNLLRASRAQAVAMLSMDGIVTRPHPASPTALEVTEGARRVRRCAAYRGGQVELQDAASQAVVDSLPLSDGQRVLDYCAGGGGKALAIAARARVDLFAHDAAPARMRDLPARARRAGARVTLLEPDEITGEITGKITGKFDLVLCDAPCSGSGAWRRAPEGKWHLTPDRLNDLTQIQDQILDTAARLVGDGGVLAYVTCSLLDRENSERIQRFLDRSSGWILAFQNRWPVRAGTDGFYVAHLTRV